MTLKRSSSMIIVGAAALAALAACTPATTKPQGEATQAMPSADVPITDQEKAEIQAGLNKLGYDAGAVDGFIGRQSRAAIRSFQADIGATADGFYSPALLQRVRVEAGEAGMAPKPMAAQAPAAATTERMTAASAPAVTAPTVAAPTMSAPTVTTPQPVAARPVTPAAPEPKSVYVNEVGGDSGGGDGGGGGGDGGGGGW
jgi:peptidoglycan hydrolase-like protein with peptidoglycan-binding domain